MEEYEIADGIYLSNVPTRSLSEERTTATVTVTIDTPDAYLELTACPDCGTITVDGDMTLGGIGMDATDFGLIATLLMRQATRA